MKACLRIPILVALAAVMACSAGAAAELARAPVAVIRIEGAIDVPSAEYLQRGLREAQARKAQCLLIILNTPGGMGEPMKEMTEALLNSPVPSIVYVSPAGAFAISAGTFITLSANIAAMHPATTIGAAHPVQLFATPKMPEPGGPEQAPAQQPGQGEGKGEAAKKPPSASPDVMMEKLVNTFALQLYVIAKERGRNADWAEKAVRESITATAEEAVKLGVVNLLADDVNDLLTKVDGWKVSLPGGKTAVLRTKDAPVVEVEASIKESFLHVLADPNILLVLLVLAGLGIMFELQNPGAILPGVIGGLCLLLSLYSMAALPVNYAGVGLIVFAMLLFLAEVKVPSHGVLTVGGVISFVIGAMMLMDTSLAPALRVSWQVIVFMALLLVLFFLFVIGAAVRAHMRKVQTGEEGMLGARGHALSRLSPDGTVLVEGERWRARASEGEIAEGDEIEVTARDGFTLVVQKRQAGGPKAGAAR